MSACLLLVRSRWPQYEDGEWLKADEARAVLVERARALPEAAAFELFDGQDDSFEEQRDELDAILNAKVWEQRVPEIVRERLVRAVETICGEDLAAEMDLMDFDGKAWLLTGGMSYGDYPTECYRDVGLVGDSLIAEAPVARADSGAGAPGAGAVGIGNGSSARREQGWVRSSF